MTTARTARLVERSDRLAPLGWLGLYVLLPVSGWATTLLASWADQTRDLETLRSVLAEGRADAIVDNIVAPGYIATAAVVHWVTRISPEDSLVALSRGSYALAVAAGLILVRALVRRLASESAVASLVAQIVFVALVLTEGTWHWSDVPWSHFYAAFLVLALCAIRFVPARFGVAQAALGGAVLGMLLSTRSFELVAVALAWAIGLTVPALLGQRPWTRLRPAQLVVGTLSLAAVAGAAAAVTGKRGLFLHGYHPGLESGETLADTVAETPTFSFGLLPVKLTQLFVDPCLYSLCPLDDYVGGSEPWRMPLLVQLPALALLPACAVVLALLVGWSARDRAVSLPLARVIRALTEMTLVAVGLVVGYSSSTLAGSSHLKFGFARDFVLPALLTSIVAVSLGTALVWRLLEAKGGLRIPPLRSKLSPSVALVVVSLVGTLAIMTVALVARAEGLPRIGSRHLESIAYDASCDEGRCDVVMDVVTTSGLPISIPEASALRFECRAEDEQFTLYVERVGDGVDLGRECLDPELVAAWPTVMGLPTDLRHLGFVEVRNARDAP